MTVKELKARLDKMPEEALVVVEGSDHSFREVVASPAKAEQTKGGFLCEYWGEEHLDEGSAVIPVALFR